MRRISVLILVSAFSCQSTTLEDGDSQFRMSNYHRALALYTEMPEEEQDLARIERTRYFLLEQGVRTLLHEDRPGDAKEVLNYLEAVAPLDRVEEIERLQGRSSLQLAEQHYDAGYELSEGNDAAAAVHELRLALSWNPEHVGAQELLGRSEEWLDTQREIGDNYYFQGMEHVRNDNPLRARTSFMHAATLLGDDSLAASRLSSITLGLAENSRAMGQFYMDAGLTGKAWVAILDSLYLEPGNAECQQLVAQIENQVQSESILTSADLAIRGGAISESDALLEKARSLGVAQHAARIAELAEDQRAQHNFLRYRRARAFELDTQLMHALEIYREIVASQGGLSWEDTYYRIQAVEQRLSLAESAYRRALDAENRGDSQAYADYIFQTMHIAVDYEDVYARFMSLPASM